MASSKQARVNWFEKSSSLLSINDAGQRLGRLAKRCDVTLFTFVTDRSRARSGNRATVAVILVFGCVEIIVTKSEHAISRSTASHRKCHQRQSYKTITKA